MKKFRLSNFEDLCHISVWALGFILLTCFILIGCSTPKQVSQLVREVQRDTVYLSNVEYDSIYVFKDRFQDRSSDTVYLKDVSVEYHYRMIHDTVRVVQRDSIPYEVTIIETKEIKRPLTWFDHLSRFCFWFIFGALTNWIFIKIKSFIIFK